MLEGTASAAEKQAEAWAPGHQTHTQSAPGLGPCPRLPQTSSPGSAPALGCPSCSPPYHPTFQNNKLEKIPPGAFSELSSLRELYLQNNYLTDEGLDNETFW